MKRKLVPLYARVVVRVESRTEEVRGKYKALAAAGFKVPETAEDAKIPDEGTVVWVGTTCDALKEGDRVLFGKWAAKPLEFAPGHYVMMEEDVIGVLADDDKQFDALIDRLAGKEAA